MKNYNRKTFYLYKYINQQDYKESNNQVELKPFKTVYSAIDFCRREVKLARSNGKFVGYKLCNSFGDVIHTFPSWRF